MVIKHTVAGVFFVLQPPLALFVNIHSFTGGASPLKTEPPFWVTHSKSKIVQPHPLLGPIGIKCSIFEVSQKYFKMT